MVNICELQNTLPNTPPIVPSMPLEELLTGSPDVRTPKDERHPGLMIDDALVPCMPAKHKTFNTFSSGVAAAVRVHRRTARGVPSKPTFLELGSGGGSLFQFLHAQGYQDYLAVDGNSLIFEYCDFAREHRDHFRILNLAQEIDFKVHFDVILSFEVIEHISEENAVSFVRTIANHCHKDTLVMLTASLQRFPGHVNVQDRAYWLDLFKSQNLVEHKESSKISKILYTCRPFNFGHSNYFVLKLSEG